MKKNFFTLIAFCLFGLAATAQTVFSEDFESGMPASWTMDGQWKLTNAAGIASQYFNPPAHTMFLGFNDDAVVNSTMESGRVLSAPIDLTLATGTLFLSFDSYFVAGGYGSGETADVRISTDDGATWTDLVSVGAGNWSQEGAFVTDYAGQVIRLAFDYDDGGGWNWGWCFDNVNIGTPPVRDAAARYLNQESFFSGGFVGAEVFPGCAITNLGTDVLTSIDLVVKSGSNIVVETITGLDLAYGQSTQVQLSTPILIQDGVNDYLVGIENANGMGPDENIDNDEGGSFTVTSVTPHPDRGVLVEEGTGTWCTWCPRGTVFIDGMSKRYPHQFVGVAVHNNDPMVLAAYNAGVTTFPGFTGFPGVIFDRTNVLDPSEIEAPFLNKIGQAPVAKLNIGAEYDEATRKITVSVDAEFLQTVGAGYKLNAVLVEDGVTGTANSYAQVNAYSGGGQGPMGGFEFLPSPVPANMMVYDHVGRALLGGFNGATGSLPDAADAGTNHGFTFNEHTIPAAQNVENMHIVAMLIGPNGQIANAGSSSIPDALNNGLFTSAKEVINHDLISVSPNPFNGSTNVQVDLQGSSEVTLQVFNSMGQMVAERNYGQLSGSNLLPFHANDLGAGVYFFHVRVDGQVATHRVTLMN